MTDKERLEEIRKLLVNLYNAVDIDEEMKYYIFNDLKIELLIEQAERVQELERDIKEWEIVNECWEEINANLSEQNKRLREVIIEAIADIEEISPHEAKKTLREALKKHL